MAIISLDILIFISALDATIVATTYVPIGNELNALDSAEWIILSYLITLTALQPLYGSISDLLGRVEAIVVAILIFLVGSILCAVSKTMPMLIASRAVQGIGGAGLMSLALVVIADIMNERQRGKYVGIFSGTYGVASAIAPVIGGAIVQNTRWQIIFWINIPFCVVALVLIVMLLRIPRPKGTLIEKAKRIDVGGALLSILGIVLLLLGLSWGGRDHKWSSTQVICTLVFGLVTLVAFAIYEWKVPKVPIVPLYLFKIRNVVFASVSSLLFGFAINGGVMFIPQWAQVVKNASPVVSGAYLVPYSVGMIVTSVVAGIIVTKTGRCHELIVVGSAVMLLGNGLLIMLGSDGSLGKIIAFLLICGLGVGACVQTINLLGQASVRGKDMAVVTTTFLFFRSLGMVLSVSVLNNVIQNVLRDQIEEISKQYASYASSIAAILKDQTLLYTLDIPQQLADAFIQAYTKGLRSGFIALTAFTGLYFILTLGFKNIELKTVLKKTINS
ncbi:MFS general substrate transporter [Coemansia reversa NRRL 1564]|uniref:MFS general substrate transporter n=1 Tax=Coemansia reversa (strain ATCC 12441 / NRRL 1564) TaxID=763665 RepID=A0A2G5B9X6_COERN|nr:MFS general substrate transporter [Coemansia reversa NRRL 1564]|eukprot:PIA15815.1 MFS general substrate transporter [Coemansia reversa NRRL 1564]